MEIILAPPIAFLIYVALVGALSGAGRYLAGVDHPTSPLKTSTYAGGERQSEYSGAPGYRPFFLIALFFAILHLGVLVLGTGDLETITGVYLAGLIIALVTLILG